METGILTFSAAASTPSRPASAAAFRRRGGPFSSQFHNGFRQFLPISTTSTSSNSQNTRSNCGFSVKALNHNLTSNWDVENYAAPSRLPRFEELDTTNMLLRQRIVFLGNQVEDTTADFIISQLLLLDSEDSEKDIKLFINSPGGSITAGMGIYDAMKMCKADISTTCFGLAASMGAFLLAAGTKGKRYCMPNARVMIHGPSGGAGGAFSEFMIRTREMAYHGIKLNKILSKLTGQTVQQLEKDTERDNFMDAWQAKAYGLVDEVIDDGKPGLVAPTAEAIAPPEARIYVLYDIDGKRSAKRRENLPSEEKLVPTEHAIGEGKDEDKGAEQKKEVSTPL